MLLKIGNAGDNFNTRKKSTVTCVKEREIIEEETAILCAILP